MKFYFQCKREETNFFPWISHSKHYFYIQIFYFFVLQELMSWEVVQKTKMESYEFELRWRAFAWLSRRFRYSRDEEIIANLVKRTDKWQLETALKDTSPEDLHKFTLQTYTQYKKDFIEKNQTEFPWRDKRFSLGYYIDRLEYELKVIKEMWFNSYFLIVSEYVRRAKEHQISVWPWRWSWAWSLLAWLVWITEVDPLPFDLLFERFLNPARISMPDFDIDFEDSLRQNVIEHCYDLYWAEKVCSIWTFMKMATKAAFKDVARTLWVPFEKSNYITNLLQDKVWLVAQVEDPEWSPELKIFYESDEKIHQAIEYWDKLTWNLRQMWVHACWIIIAPEKVTTYTPTQYNKEEDHTIVSQYDWPTLESIWLLKMDFLWLRNLSIIKNCVKIIKARADQKWEKIPEMFEEFLETMSLDIPIDDEETYKSIFQQGDTTWIFQFESPWMRRYLIELIPEKIDNLVAMNALYRPWPMEFIPSYINRRLWKEEIEYMYPDLKAELTRKYWAQVAEEERRKLIEDLDPFLKETYGIAVYQEQLMFLVQAMAWFSLWEADLLRRGVWKKKKYVIEQLKKEFIERWASFHWYKPETTTQIYEKMIEPAASYSFNKSHSVCYAMIAYQTAYLKVHYPIEFSAALIRSVEEDIDTQSFYFSEIQQRWIDVLQPDVNISFNHVAAIDQSVRIWFISIKWVWFDTWEEIQEERKRWWKFTSLEDFCKRCSKVINKKSLEWLIKSWALDQFEDRKVLRNNVDQIINWISNSANASQGLFWDLENKIPLKKVEKSTLMERLMMEQDVFKSFVSWNPLDWLYKFIKKRTLLSNIKDKTDVGNFEIVWYIKDIRRAKKKWFFITIEDISDSFDIFLSETYGLTKFDLVIVSWRKKNRIQISKIVKTSREKLKELAWWSFDENDTVSAVKKARAGEQQQLNIERIKAEIVAENTKMAEENKVNQNKSTFNNEETVLEDLELEDIEMDEDLTEEEKVDEDNTEDVIEDISDPDTQENGIVIGEDENIENSDDDKGKEEEIKEEKQDSETKDDYTLDDKEILIITAENLPFSKMKSLMAIVAWNPWDITIQVLWNEMKVSEKWLGELKKIIQE